METLSRSTGTADADAGADAEGAGDGLTGGQLATGALIVGLAVAQSVWLADRGSPPNDEGALLTNAARILDGAVYYRDLDSYPFPAAAYLLALAMSVFGEHVAVARALAGLVYCGVVASLYAAARPVLGARRAAGFGLSLLCFKFLAWPAFTSYMYSDLAFVFACASVSLLVTGEPGERRRLALAGLCTGLCLASKQNLGIYLAGGIAGVMLLPRSGPGVSARPLRARWLDATVFTAGAALPVVAMLGYFAAHGALGGLLYSGLVRPFTGYLPTSSIAFATPLAWWKLGSLHGMEAFPYFVSPYWVMLSSGNLLAGAGNRFGWIAGELATRLLYTALPVLFAIAGVRGLRRLRAGPLTAADFRLVLLTIAAAAALASAFPRADAFHVLSVYPLPLLLAFALTSSSRTLRPSQGGSTAPARAWLARAETAAILAALALTTALLFRYEARLTERLTLPRADLRVAEGAAWIGSVARYIAEEVPPGEPLLVYGNEAYYYFFADRYPNWPFAQLYPGQAGGDRGRALAARLRASPPPLVVRGLLAWPGLPALETYTPELLQYMRRHYEAVDDVFERHPAPGGRAPGRAFVAVWRRREPS